VPSPTVGIRGGASDEVAPLPECVPHERWWADAAVLACRFRNAAPFPHLHLVDLLVPDVARAAAAEFPAPDAHAWINYVHVNERKMGLSLREAFPPLLGRIVDELNSDRFVAWLAAVTGIAGLEADPMLLGGGLHQSPRGGYLNIHRDFLHHHYRPHLRRRLNLIVYLNPDWDDAWGGAIELWDRAVAHRVATIPPRLNHALLFDTSEISYHGHPHPLACPAHVTRKSIALYYYTADASPGGSSTHYRARPDDGPLRRALIGADNRALALYTTLKRRFRFSESLASRVLGLLGRRHS
jgi:hypothetical protein